jgi:hypothetical protein
MSDKEKSPGGESQLGKKVELTAKDKSGIVRCQGFRCFAILGADGVWHDNGGKPLEVLEVIAEF